MAITLNRRQFLEGALFAASAVVLAGCDDSGGADVAPEEREYLDDSQMDALFTNPDDCKGKWVKLPGKVLDSSEKDGDTTALQAFYDTITYDRSYIVYSQTDETFSSDDYILVDGRVDGSYTGTNAFGGEVTVPLIKDATIIKSDYMTVVAPATATVEPAVSVTENDVTFTCDKVEYADIETRVYLTVSNASANTITYAPYSIRIIANGQQVDQDSSTGSVYAGNYPELSYDLTAGASTSGILVFPPMDPEAFQVVVPDIFSDDFITQFDDVTLDIPAA